jgi:hypothetical protein
VGIELRFARADCRCMRLVPSRRTRRLTVAGALWTLVLLFALIALVAKPHEARSSAFPPRWPTHLDRALGRAVDVLSEKRDSVVWCWSVSDWKLRRDPWPERVRVWKGSWGGYVYRGAVQLAPNECQTLKLLRTVKAPVWRWKHPEMLAWSAYALAHESVHVAGQQSERRATCWGLQRVAETAQLLARTSKEGRYLAELVWKTWYPKARPSYRSRECRDGGRLDLHPKSQVWP